MSNFVAISRSVGSINELSLLVEDISSIQLTQESTSVVIGMRSGKDFNFSFVDYDKALELYTLLRAEIKSSGRTLTAINVDDFEA